jgi:hypothetical protein
MVCVRLGRRRVWRQHHVKAGIAGVGSAQQCCLYSRLTVVGVAVPLALGINPR